MLSAIGYSGAYDCTHGSSCSLPVDDFIEIYMREGEDGFDHKMVELSGLIADEMDFIVEHELAEDELAAYQLAADISLYQDDPWFVRVRLDIKYSVYSDFANWTRDITIYTAFPIEGLMASGKPINEFYEDSSGESFLGRIGGPDFSCCRIKHPSESE